MYWFECISHGGSKIKSQRDIFYARIHARIGKYASNPFLFCLYSLPNLGNRSNYITPGNLVLSVSVHLKTWPKITMKVKEFHILGGMKDAQIRQTVARIRQAVPRIQQTVAQIRQTLMAADRCPTSADRCPNSVDSCLNSEDSCPNSAGSCLNSACSCQTSVDSSPNSTESFPSRPSWQDCPNSADSCPHSAEPTREYLPLHHLRNNIVINMFFTQSVANANVLVSLSDSQ